MHSLGVALAFPGSAVLVEIEGGEGDGEIERERENERAAEGIWLFTGALSVVPSKLEGPPVPVQLSCN